MCTSGLDKHYKGGDYKLACSTLLLSVAVGADKFAIKANSKGLSSELRVGYTFAIQNVSWKRGGTKVAVTNLNLSDFFSTFAFGGGNLGKAD